MTFDNRHFDLTLEGERDLRAALQLAFADHYCTHWTAIDYAAREGPPAVLTLPTLILLWAPSTPARAGLPFADLARLPTRLSADQAQVIVSEWLRTVAYGPEPDHDGSNGAGFRLFNEDWGHVASFTTAICGIQPAWAIYGK